MSKPRLQVQTMKTSDLIPYARNAKQHPDEQVAQIAASIREFGMNDPVAVWHDKMGERGLFARCILSTIAGGLVDTIVVTLLMYGFSYSIMANLQNIILTYALKIIVEVIVFPLITLHVIKWAKTLD